MNKEDIIRMAKEAGFYIEHGEIYSMSTQSDHELTEPIERFAALVASAERERLTDAAMKAAEKAVDVAMALEREACANLVDHILKEGGGTWGDAIRARAKE